MQQEAAGISKKECGMIVYAAYNVVVADNDKLGENALVLVKRPIDRMLGKCRLLSPNKIVLLVKAWFGGTIVLRAALGVSSELCRLSQDRALGIQDIPPR